MITVRRLILLVGAALLVAGVIGLLLPVSVSDGKGGSIGCGNAVAGDLSAARAANDNIVVPNIPIINQIVPHTDFVAQCNSSLSGRRAWAIPLTVIGLIVVGGAWFVQRPRGAPAGGI